MREEEGEKKNPSQHPRVRESSAVGVWAKEWGGVESETLERRAESLFGVGESPSKGGWCSLR